MQKISIRSATPFLIVTAVFGWLLSFRLLQTPLGLTADEGAFGINAVLLSQTGRDETGRYLPLFALSLEGSDWRQPVTQYFLAGLFKLFGPSVYMLRFSSVIVALFSGWLVYVLANRLMGKWWGVVAGLVFFTTPIVFIHSHMGLDNIMPVPFALLWLLGIFLFEKKKIRRYLILAGISLGIGFYTYKGMRGTVPAWAILTCIYVFFSEKNKRSAFLNVLIFSTGLIPFFAAIPFINTLYPGAIFDGQGVRWMPVYDFLLPYLSSFDLSFLYITGDATIWHSTGKHGMMLLATLPLFVLGIWEIVKRRGYWLFVLGSFLTPPAFYGFVNSVHRASRLMSMVPAYALICALGAFWLWNSKKSLLILICVLGVMNFADFTYFYWYKYPELTRHGFGDLSYYRDYVSLGRYSREKNLVPYVDSGSISEKDVSAWFFELAYLGRRANYVTDQEQLPTDGILLSSREEIPGLKRLDTKREKYWIHVNP